MGKFLCEFDQTLEDSFVYCKQCRAHIALIKDRRQNFVTSTENRMIVGDVFVKAINLTRSNPLRERRCGDRLLENVSCVNCCTFLGHKFVEVADHDLNIKVGYYLLDLLRGDKFMSRKGLDIINPPLP